MNPALQGMLYSQMMQPQGHMDAYKEQLAFNPQEQRNAEGLAIQQFFANMATSRNPDQLGRINESFNPAIKSYMAEQQRVQDLNAALMEKDERRREKEEERAIRRENLNIRKAESGIGAHAGNITRHQLLQEGYLPLASVPKNQQLYEVKRMDEGIHKGQEWQEAIVNAKALKRIISDHPNLSESLTLAFVETDPDKAKKMFSLLKNNAVNKKEKDAIQEYEKRRKNLISHQIKGSPARIMTDYHKHAIEEGTPGITMSSDVQNKLFDEMINMGNPYVEDAKRFSDARKYGLMAPVRFHEYSEPSIVNERNNNRGENINDILQIWRQQHPEAANIPDDYILKALQEGKIK